jgi:DNA repair protein RadC
MLVARLSLTTTAALQSSAHKLIACQRANHVTHQQESNKMTIKSPRRRRYFIADSGAADTPAEKITMQGTASILSDAELLGLFLTSNGNRVERARSVITMNNGLRSLIDAGSGAKGLTGREIVNLAAAMELSTRHLAAGLQRGEALSDPQAAGRYFAQRIRSRETEVFCALFLDTRHRVIAFEELFHGSIDGAEIHPRVVATRAMQHNAVAVIVAHNHPSGNPEPSAADRAVTARLKQSLALLDIRLLDHFVIADGAPVSLAARGWV